MPNWLNAVRSTSANFTSRRMSPTSGRGTCIALATLGVAFFTISRIFAAVSAEEIFPEIITTSLEASSSTGSEGKAS